MNAPHRLVAVNDLSKFLGNLWLPGQWDEILRRERCHRFYVQESPSFPYSDTADGIPSMSATCTMGALQETWSPDFNGPVLVLYGIELARLEKIPGVVFCPSWASIVEGNKP